MTAGAPPAERFCQDEPVREVFRPGFGRGLTVVLGCVAVLSLAIVATRSGLVSMLLTLPWVALFMTCCWAIFWRPSVEVSDAGVRLVNVTRTIDVPWPAVVGVETRYALTLDTVYGRFSAWAAPAPGAGPALRAAMRSLPPQSDAGADADATRSVTIGDVQGTPSGDAAEIVRRRWQRLQDAGFLDDPQLEFERAPICWHWRIGATIVVLAAISAATLVVA